MKKYLLTLATTLLSLAASAETFSPGDGWTKASSTFGNWDSALPFYLEEANYSSQTLLPTDLLSSIAPATTAQGATVSKITDVTFKFLVGDCYDMAGEATLKVWIQNSDAEQYPEVGGDKQWFEISPDAVTGTLNFDDPSDLPEYAYDTYELTITLDEPFEYTGGSIILTFKSESSLEETVLGEGWFSEYFSFNPYNGTDKVRTLSGSTPTDNISGNLQNTSSSIPALNFTYTTETKALEGEVATIENVEYGVTETAAKDANVLFMTFDINGPADCQSYEIKIDGKYVGTTTDKTVKVSYLTNDPADRVVTLVPSKDGVTGGTFTIPGGAFDDLFKDFTLSTEATRAYTSFKVWEPGSKETYAAAVVKYNVEAGGATIIKMKGSGNNGTVSGTATPSDWADDIFTLNGNYDDFAANNGCRYFQSNGNWQKCYFVENEITGLSREGLTVNLSISYPVAVADPTLTDTEDYTTTTFDKAAKSYTAYIDPAEDGVLVAELDYGNTLHLVEETGDNKGHFTFYAPNGHHIWTTFLAGASAAPAKAIARAAADEPDYTTNGLTTLGYQNQGQAYVHDANATAAGTLHVATAPAIGEDGAPTNVAQYEYYGFEGDGQMSGVSDVAVDADSAVEYFNLQGIRVANPKGGVYIRRQGSKIEKVNIL